VVTVLAIIFPLIIGRFLVCNFGFPAGFLIAVDADMVEVD